VKSFLLFPAHSARKLRVILPGEFFSNMISKEIFLEYLFIGRIELKYQKLKSELVDE